MNILTEVDFKLVQAFASDTTDGVHLYGHAEVINKEGVTIGTLPVNSAEEASNDYFISGESICGYAYTSINYLTLIKGHCSLTIDYTPGHDKQKV